LRSVYYYVSHPLRGERKRKKYVFTGKRKKGPYMLLTEKHENKKLGGGRRKKMM